MNPKPSIAKNKKNFGRLLQKDRKNKNIFGRHWWMQRQRLRHWTGSLGTLKLSCSLLKTWCLPLPRNCRRVLLVTRWTIIFYYIFDYIELTTLLVCCPSMVLICEMAQEIKVMMMEVRIDKEIGHFIQCTMRLPSCNYCVAEVGNEVAATNNLSH